MLNFSLKQCTTHDTSNFLVICKGLAFRRGTHDLYSASHDRSVKVWNVDENAYVETL